MKRFGIRFGAMTLSLGLLLTMAAAHASAAAEAPARDAEHYSAAALYNAGNAYARAGKPALAVLEYERARLLAPHDPDLQANLRAVWDKAGVAGQTRSWFEAHGRIAGPDTMYWLGCGGVLRAGGAYLAAGLGRRRRGALTAAALIGVALLGASVCDALATASTLRAAVVIQASPAGASPIAAAEPLFTVPAAALVHVRDEYRDFALVRDLQGRDGWVARGNLMRIVPLTPAAARP